MNIVRNLYPGILFTLLFFTHLACAQAPADRPKIADAAFDQRLENLLSFTVPLITVQELQERQQEVYLFDTREKEEYDISHIDGAEYLGYDDFDARRLKNVPKDAPIVVYCSVGYRSEKIGEQLQKMGYTNVSNLYGSLFEWVNLGQAVINSDGQPTQKVHTYNKKWSRWVRTKDVKKVW